MLYIYIYIYIYIFIYIYIYIYIHMYMYVYININIYTYVHKVAYVRKHEVWSHFTEIFALYIFSHISRLKNVHRNMYSMNIYKHIRKSPGRGRPSSYMLINIYTYVHKVAYVRKHEVWSHFTEIFALYICSHISRLKNVHRNMYSMTIYKYIRKSPGRGRPCSYMLMRLNTRDNGSKISE